MNKLRLAVAADASAEDGIDLQEVRISSRIGYAAFLI